MKAFTVMTINITLLVQMIHFLVAYYILKIVVLKPAIDIVVQKQKEQVLLQQQIAEAKHETDQRLKENEQAFEKDREKAKELVPELISRQAILFPVDKIKHDCLRDGCEMENIETSLQEIAASIRKRIEHA